MIRIIIGDDHAIFRKELEETLAEIPDFKLVAAVADGAQLVETVRLVPCDVVILDLSIPGLNGFEVLQVLETSRPELPVVVLSTHPEELYAQRCLQAGASAYLTKGSSPRRLESAIRATGAGDS